MSHKKQLCGIFPQEGTLFLHVSPPTTINKPFFFVLQKQTSVAATTETNQQVPASVLALPASASAVSRADRRHFKQQLVSMTEDIPSSRPVITKPQPQSSFVHSQITTLDTGKGGSTQKVKDSVPRSTSSFRRSVAPAAGDNWIVSSTTSVSS